MAAMKPSSCVLIPIALIPFLLLPLIAAGADAGNSSIPGSWVPIENLTDPYVLQIAEASVVVHNHYNGTNLTFVSLVSGESQLVAGTNYRLVLDAQDGDKPFNTTSSRYQAAVYDNFIDKYWQFISFQTYTA